MIDGETGPLKKVDGFVEGQTDDGGMGARQVAYKGFGAALEQIKKRFFFLKADFSGLSVRLEPGDIDRSFAKESFPHRLLSSLASSPGDREALQAAYELICELEEEKTSAKGRS